MPSRITLSVGERYYQLTVVADSGIGVARKALFRCDCGAEKWISVPNVRQGRVKGCGMCYRAAPSLFIGEKRGRLTVLSEPFSRGRAFYIRCKCDCGTEFECLRNDVAQGHTKSCGCYSRDLASERNRTHGMARSRTYVTWRSMLNRCYLPEEKAFANYGARGITVCDAWRNSFEAFLAYMGERPEGMTLDRYPNGAGNYEPGNCRWATLRMQANNTRRNKILSFNGKSMTISDWAHELGLKARTLHARLSNGWTVERALTQQLRKISA